MGRCHAGQQEHKDKTIYKRDRKIKLTFGASTNQFESLPKPISGLNDELCYNHLTMSTISMGREHSILIAT